MADAAPPGGRRVDALARVADSSVDVLVIGAGIIGAATAWAAAQAGASVAVLDRGDLAGATSSASSKLVHGGLRYLAMGDVRHVREAHAERRLNAARLAPHLVRPLRFVVPVRGDSALPGWQLGAGVLAYAALAGFRDGRSGPIGARRARRLVPDLAAAGLRGGVLYHDHQTNDARLTLAALQAAAASGAAVLPHAEVVALRRHGSRVAGAEVVDRLGGQVFAVSARSVVNATGPWVDRVRRLEEPHAGTTVRLAKGAHIVLDGAVDWRAAVTTPLADGRVSFAMPWEGLLLLGTTDDVFEGDPAAVEATDADEAQIRAEASRALAPDALRRRAAVSRFAGVRALPVGDEPTSRTRRETIVSRGAGGMVSVAGGKLTTWRRIGAGAADLALRELGARGAEAPSGPLPGAAPVAAVRSAVAERVPRLDPAVRAHLAHLYGMLALDVVALADADPGLLERIHPDGPDIWAQVPHAAAREWAATVDDVLRRRTTVWLRGLANDAIRVRVAAMLGAAGATLRT